MKKIVTGVVALALILSLGYVGTAKADDVKKSDIAVLDYTYTDASDVEVDESDATVSDLNATKYGDKKTGYAFSSGDAILLASVTGDASKTLEWCKDDDDIVSPEYTMGDGTEVEPVMAATKKNNWLDGTTPYFQMSFSTKGYTDVDVSAYVAATKKGPRDYQLSYAVGDASEFTPLTDETAKLSLTKGKTMTQISGTLPEAASNQEKVVVRVEIASMETVSSVSGSAVYLYDNPTSGEAAINHIAIRGIAKAAPSNSPAQPTATSAPTQEPASTAAPTKAPTIAATVSPTVAPTVAPTQKTESKKIKSISLNVKKKTLKKGKTYQLKVTAKYTSGKTKKISASKLTWKSAKKKIATVSSKGKVKARKPGKVKITAAYSKKIKSSCVIKVVKK